MYLRNDQNLQCYREATYPIPADPVRHSVPFGLLMKACMANNLPEAFHGDLYHDAMFLKSTIDEVNSRFKVGTELDIKALRFRWVLRDYGTYIGRINGKDSRGYPVRSGADICWERKEGKGFELTLEKLPDSTYNYIWTLRQVY